MSKSLGNVIDPKDILHRFGAEPFRMWAAVEGNLVKTDFRCSFDRIEGTKKTITKLWNVARFISTFPRPSGISSSSLLPADKWILEETNRMIEDARERYEEYDFHAPATKIKHMIWETFASHYLELVKNRAYNKEGKFNEDEQRAAHFTLHFVLEAVLRLLAPVVPYITHRIYHDLNGGDIHFTTFPKPADRFSLSFTTAELEELNRTVWKTKKERGVSLREELREFVVPDKFRGLEKDLKHMHNARELTFGKIIEVKI
jgi:valyl-tRNA synthetase